MYFLSTDARHQLNWRASQAAFALQKVSPSLLSGGVSLLNRVPLNEIPTKPINIEGIFSNSYNLLIQANVAGAIFAGTDEVLWHFATCNVNLI